MLTISVIPTRRGAFQPSVCALSGKLAGLSTQAAELPQKQQDAAQSAAVADEDQELEEDFLSDEDAEFYDWDPSCKKGG